MKKIICALLFVLIGLTAYPQLSWNVKAGVNLSNFTGDIDTRTGVGFRVGVGMEYDFGYGFFLNPSLLLSNRTIKADNTSLGIAEGGSAYEAKINALYIDLPVLLGTRLWFNDQFSLSVGIGPYIGYGAGGKVTVDESDWKEDTFGPVFLKRFDWGFDSRLAIEYRMFFLEVESQLGLQDLSNGFNASSDESVKNSNIVISLGCRF